MKHMSFLHFHIITYSMSNVHVVPPPLQSDTAVAICVGVGAKIDH